MRRFVFALAGLAALIGASTGPAQVDVDPNREYVVTPEVGPWMICAAYYTGPQAAELARELVLEIRSRFRLPAYVFNRGEKERRARKEHLDRIRQADPEGHSRVKMTRIENQYAVLVGGYKDMETTRKALDDIKKLKPSNPRLMPFLRTERTEPSAEGKKDDVRGAYVSPFLDSFVIRNPTVPQEAPRDNKPDPFLKQLNADEEYSLLRCKEPWTLVVAVHHGTTVIQSQAASSSFLDRFFGTSGGKALANSAHNAHNLAEALRKLGYEAYVLHTRQASLVTVGGYQSAEDPRIQQIQYALTNKLQLTHGVQLLPQPIPMEIPRP